MDRIHAYIRKLREMSGRTQNDMAMLMGIGRTAYINFEKGRTELFSRNLTLFASVVGMRPEDIICPEESEARSGALLSESSDAVEMLEEVVRDYEGRLAELRERIREKDEILRSQAETISSLNKTIRHLLGPDAA